MKKYLVPSLLSANFYNIESDLEKLEKCNIEIIHLDVMDGFFVPNISFGIPVIKSFNDNTQGKFIFDTHLMITKPERYIDEFIKVGSNILTIHLEATGDYKNVLKEIKNKGIKAGISVNPETDVEKLGDVLDIADLVLIMSVHPGFGGQKFIESALGKIKYLNDERKKNGYKYIIEVDGGINLSNVKTVLDIGVDYIVAGSSVFNGNVENNIKEFNKIIGDYNE